MNPTDSRSLFLIQDSDRPMHVVANDYNEALAAWKKVVLAENPECAEDELELPDGIAFVADGFSLLVVDDHRGTKETP
jgi:hypothetical protein